MSNLATEKNCVTKLEKAGLVHEACVKFMQHYGSLMARADESTKNHNFYVAAEYSRIAARQARIIGDKELEIQAATSAYQKFLTAAQYPLSFPQFRAYLPPATREECLREALHTAQEFSIGEASALERIKNSLEELVKNSIIV